MEAIHGGTATVTVPLSAVVDALVTGGSLAWLSDSDLLAEVRGLETARRRLAVEHRLLLEVEQRGPAGRLALRSTSGLLQGLLRLSPHEAKRRVDAARGCGPRRTLTGARLEPLLPALAAAQAAGEVSPEHVNVIVRTLDKFPTGLTVALFAAAEETLLQAARAARPREVAIAGARYRAYLDPDGVLADEREQDRQRELQLVPTDDGRWRVTGRLTGVCGAQLLATLTPPRRPAPRGRRRAGPAQPRPAAA
jgi:hypothetical protein